MGFEVEILVDSVCETAPHRLTTFRVKCPAMIAQQLARHRTVSMPDFSLSVGSQRAIPLAKQIEAVERDPAMPVRWGSARPGMQAGEELPPVAQRECIDQWLLARDQAVVRAKALGVLGLHKEVAARVLIPYAHYEMVLTSCWPGLANFFTLRCDDKADPTTRRLAVRMALAYRDSTPRQLEPGDWALPYVTDEERDSLSWFGDPVWIPEVITAKRYDLLKFSVARCSRVSFLRHGTDKPDPEKDRKSHDDRVAAGDWSVAEHQCRMPYPGEDIRGLEGNLPGVIQYRQLLSPNVHTDFDFATLDRFREDWP